MVDNLISVEAVVNSSKRFGISKIEQSLCDISDSTNTSSNKDNNGSYIDEEDVNDEHDYDVKKIMLKTLNVLKRREKYS